ncbi:MAG: LacI family transcriptional regulator [Xanthomonadales bacterium]|jgi:LacI family repressor for deo operon, udp, cdd, tsx, nupC, and nupG|nr:LacI family transcriptional regulator [Xanthomonadales bacterium]MDH3941542.1 LacI family transcriptional regulator [Xanthomonadales bacterium]MDH3999628.1 LacI family transcriptional regulator [Xanthomonadales bacterium]
MSQTANTPGKKVTTKQPVSIKDVARLAEVSIATVSRCVNDPDRVRASTRNRVEAAILQTGYSPNPLAQSFRRGKTKVIMVVLPSVGDPFFTEVMKGLREVANASGYSLLINETQFNTMTADEIGAMVVSRQADGIVLLASVSPFGTAVLSSDNNRRLPVVVGCEIVSLQAAGYPSVHIDNQAAAIEVTDYLLELGHRRIAFIHGQESSLLTKDREDGYRLSMLAAGLSIEDGWVVGGNLTITGAIQATQKLLRHRHRPTAIFCANDEMAMGCMHAIKSAGLKIPQDVSVIGFDDVRYAAIMDPPLSSVRQPAKDIGEQVMLRLLGEIETGRSTDAEPVIVPHELVLRRSVAPPVD